MSSPGSFAKPLPINRKRPAEKAGDDEIKEFVDQAVNNEILTPSTFSSFLVNLEQSILDNTTNRERHAEEPTKFFDSEATLYEMVIGLNAAAADIDLVELMTEEDRFIECMFILLRHPNADISTNVLRFITEVLDTELDRPLDAPIIYAFATRLANLVVDWSPIIESGDIVYPVLEAFENLLFWMDPEFPPTESLVEGWPVWLLNSMTIDLDIEILHQCSDFLVELATNSLAVRNFLLEKEALQVLIKILAEWKDKDDRTATRIEFINNTADIVCALLLTSTGKGQFIANSGFEMCFLLIKAMKGGRIVAPQILSFATSGPESHSTCIELVQRGGLSFIFSLLMGSPSQFRKQYRDFDHHQDLEYLLSILISLLRYTPRDTPEWPRLLKKFTERNGEKVKRLEELLSKENSWTSPCLVLGHLILADPSHFDLLSNDTIPIVKERLQALLLDDATIEEEYGLVLQQMIDKLQV